MNLSILSIIPARSGSKGIIDKNIQLIGGKPLVVHSIIHSLKSKLVNRIVVSTDDDIISKISLDNGAEVIKRPKNISGDKSHTDLALKHVLNILLKKEAYQPNLVVLLQATSPIRKPWQIDGAIKKLMSENADTCFSACSEHFTGRWEINHNGYAKPINYKINKRPMRQDYPIQYLENGSICVFKPEILNNTGNRFGKKNVIYLMNAIESLQIDNQADLQLLKKIIPIYYSSI